MIAPYSNRRLQLSAFDEIVDCLAHLRTLAVTKPTDSRRKSLKLHTLASKSKPATKRRVFRKKFEREVIRLAYVFGVAGKSDPAERPFAFAEERPYVFGDETGNFECVRAASVESLLANVVAVIESNGPG